MEIKKGEYGKKFLVYTDENQEEQTIPMNPNDKKVLHRVGTTLYIERTNGTRRVAFFPIGKSLTDQSYKESSDINNVAKKCEGLGYIPETGKQPLFLDETQLPKNLLEAFQLVRDAEESFAALPSEIRKAVDNDPTKFEEFVKDEKNYDLCYKHGIVEKRPAKDEKAPEPAPEPLKDVPTPEQSST